MLLQSRAEPTEQILGVIPRVDFRGHNLRIHNERPVRALNGEELGHDGIHLLGPMILSIAVSITRLRFVAMRSCSIV